MPLMTTPALAPAPVPALFLTTAQVTTFFGTQELTHASGFFFEREDRLYLVTSRHVFQDLASQHQPDRLEVDLHLDTADLTQSVRFSVPLFRDGDALWHQGRDACGDIDVAVIQLERAQLPLSVVLQAFTAQHLTQSFSEVEAGESLLVVGFPLGFHDVRHHLPVLRHAVMASPYGVRFQGQGYFLTDARTHRGISGAPVVMRDPEAAAQGAALPWKLLGIHSSSLDVGDRDRYLDHSLGLNCVWYANILLVLTRSTSAVEPAAGLRLVV
jgi:S1-C subfamily serine protease